MSNFFESGMISLFVLMKPKFFLIAMTSQGPSNETIPFLGEQIFRWLPYVGVVLLLIIAYLLYRRNKK